MGSTDTLDSSSNAQERLPLQPLTGNLFCLFFFQAEDGIRDLTVTGVQTCALPISPTSGKFRAAYWRRALAQVRSQWESSASPSKRMLPLGVTCLRKPRRSARSLSSRGRSEERRVGEEGRSRWSPYH